MKPVWEATGFNTETLMRRIGELQEIVKRRAGAERQSGHEQVALDLEEFVEAFGAYVYISENTINAHRQTIKHLEERVGNGG